MSGTEADLVLFELVPWQLTIIVVASLVTSIVHGASGLAGGFLMAAILTPSLE